MYTIQPCSVFLGKWVVYKTTPRWETTQGIFDSKAEALAWVARHG